MKAPDVDPYYFRNLSQIAHPTSSTCAPPPTRLFGHSNRPHAAASMIAWTTFFYLHCLDHVLSSRCSCSPSGTPHTSCDVQSLLFHRQHRCHRQANIGINGRGLGRAQPRCDRAQNSLAKAVVKWLVRQFKAHRVDPAEWVARTKAKPEFDLGRFFEIAAKGRSISTHRKNEIIFRRELRQTPSSISKRAKSKSRLYLSRARKPWSRCLVQMSS